MNRTCEHKVQYYETDQMGVVHHSNYIRWFEEAHTEAMEQMGMSYYEMEEEGIMSPVLAVEAEYLRTISYGDIVAIDSFIQEYNGIKMTVGYEVYSGYTGKLHCRGTSRHCFIDSDGRPVSLKQKSPKFHEMFLKGLADYEKSDRAAEKR